MASAPVRTQPIASSQVTSLQTNKPAEVEELYIAVMGCTGAGKSRFISACSGQDVQIGHSLESCTSEVDDYDFVWEGYRVHLIDTPGFDDTHKSDREVLEGIASWMSTSYSQDIKLTGVIYMHRITDVRIGGTSLRNLTMFKKLCGDEFYPRVFLVTSMWDKIAEAEGATREKELIEKGEFWGTMVDSGASFVRHDGTSKRAQEILSQVVRNRRVQAPEVLKVQHEMVDDGLRLDETSAGRQFEAELLRQRERHEREMKQMQEDVKMLLDMNQKRAAQETERQRKLFEDRVAQSFEDQAKLKSSLQDIQQRQAEELARMQRQVERDRMAYEEKIRKLQQAQSELNAADPASARAQDLQSQISQDQTDAAQLATNIDTESKSFRKKMKTVLVNSRNWVKEHPNTTRLATSGIQFLLKIAEWDIISQGTGVPVGGVTSLLSNMLSGLASNADAAVDGIDASLLDLGGEVGSLDLGDVSASDTPTNDPSTEGTDGETLDGGTIDGSPLPDTSSQDTLPLYSPRTDYYDGDDAYAPVAQQEMSSAIQQSQQFEADQAQQVANQLPISGIAAGEQAGP